MKTFKVNDLVFAKVRGYSPWPAKIIEINKKYVVYFYGTGERGFMRLNELFPYEECKKKFISEKLLKRKKFFKAVQEIEAEIQQRKERDNEDNKPKDNTNEMCCSTSENQHITQTAKQNQIRPKKDKKVNSLTSKQTEILCTEQTIYKLILTIKTNLTTNFVDVNECLECLKQYNNLNILPISLKKNPAFVFVIENLYNYVGNASVLDENNQDRNLLINQMNLLRKEAKEIYTGFEKMFNINGKKNFHEFFINEIAEFRKKTSHLTEKEVCLLTDESDIPILILD